MSAKWRHCAKQTMKTLTHAHTDTLSSIRMWTLFFLAKNYDTWWCACFGWAYMIMLCLFCLQVSSLFRAIFASNVCTCIVRHRGMFDRVQFCVNAFTSRFLPQFCRDKHSRTHTRCEVLCIHIIPVNLILFWFWERARARERNENNINAICNQRCDNNSAIWWRRRNR